MGVFGIMRNETGPAWGPVRGESRRCLFFAQTSRALTAAFGSVPQVAPFSVAEASAAPPMQIALTMISSAPHSAIVLPEASTRSAGSARLALVAFIAAIALRADRALRARIALGAGNALWPAFALSASRPAFARRSGIALGTRPRGPGGARVTFRACRTSRSGIALRADFALGALRPGNALRALRPFGAFRAGAGRQRGRQRHDRQNGIRIAFLPLSAGWTSRIRQSPRHGPRHCFEIPPNLRPHGQLT